MATVRWYGPDVERQVRAEMGRRVLASAILVQNHARTLVSVPGPDPSLPGEPPHKQVGILRQSITYEVETNPDVVAARVGSNLNYAMWLELGTSRMQPRPWLRRALAEKTSEIQSIFGRPMTI